MSFIDSADSLAWLILFEYRSCRGIFEAPVLFYGGMRKDSPTRLEVCLTDIVFYVCILVSVIIRMQDELTSHKLTSEEKIALEVTVQYREWKSFSTKNNAEIRFTQKGDP